MQSGYFVVRGTRLEPRLTNPITERHMIIHAENADAALQQARKALLEGEHMAVVGRCYF